MQDYYVGLKFNDLSRSIKHLYRLFISAQMLRDVKVKGSGKAHDYPLRMLVNLLVMEYWRKSGHVAFKMMKNNMCLFNEEQGEISFSMLARLVLGDSLKSDFEHMNKMYNLIPAFRQVKTDVLADSARPSSLNWRHRITPQDDSVQMVGTFFRRTIRSILEGTFTAYDGTSLCNRSADASLNHRTNEFMPQVYNPDVLSNLPAMFSAARSLLTCSFLGPDLLDIWPEAKADESEDSLDEDDALQSAADELFSEEEHQEWGASWRDCAIGHFAAVRVELEDDGAGLDIYKIELKNEEDRKDIGEVRRTFNGVRYDCRSVKNNDFNCLHGSWYSARERGEVDDWSVVVYFPRLLASGKIPAAAVSTILEVCQSSQVFQHNQLP